MTFLPIVARELRVAARRRGAHWARVGGALAALALGGWTMLMPDMRTPQHLGMALFVVLSVLCLLYSLLAGIFTTADCLSEEKREGTLGLLFLTDLRGYDIVLGKLAATSLNSFYGMLAIFPVMAIPLLAGGVTGAEFGRVTLVSMNNLLFSLAVGMFCSAISKDERKAIVLAFLIILFFAALLPFFGLLMTHWSRLPDLACLLSPGWAGVYAFDDFYKSLKGAKGNLFYQSVLSVHGLTWILLILTGLIVPRTWQDRAESSSRLRLREIWQRWRHGTAASRRTGRRQRLDLNPFYWLAARDRMKVILVWVLLGAAGLLWSWGLWRHPLDWKDGVAYVWTAFIATRCLKFWLAMEACRRLGADRKSGALELLLATPLRVEDILRGQLLALGKQFAAPAAIVLLAYFCFLITARNEGDFVDLAFIGVGDMVMFAADLITLSWVSMWTGLTSRQANRAAAGALARVLVLPWVIFAVMWTVMVVVPRAHQVSLGGLSEGHFMAVSWVIVGLGTNLFLGFRARQRLMSDFRSLATQRVDSRRAARPELSAAEPSKR